MKRPTRIVIFAKAPLPGFAKTRLIPALGASGAADLARRLLMQTVEQALAARVGPVELCIAPSVADPVWDTLSISAAVQWSNQGEGDLGERMARATQRVIECGDSVLLMGTDCPQLGAAQLRQASTALLRKDAVLLPTFDGGYALLGLNRFSPSLFAGIAWSTDTVAFETMHRLNALNWTVARCPTVHDIDVPADLAWLPATWPEATKLASAANHAHGR